MSEALIFASTNPQYDNRFLIEIQVQYLKIQWTIFCHIVAQRIFLLYRRLQKIEQVEPDHCDRYQNNRNKNCN